MNELEVKVVQNPGSIELNFEEIKEALELQMTAYTSLEITEDKIKDAKADLATLRKISKAVDDKRKSVKREFMQPYEEFNAKVSELLGVINEPITMIDGKLKEFEAKRIAEKQQHLQELYKDNIGELEEYLPYNVLFSSKWNNATTKDKDIIFDISEAKQKVTSDLAVIKALNSEIEDDLLRAYRVSGNNLATAITKNSDYLAAKQRAEERIREEEKRKAEQQRIEEEKKLREEIKEELKEEQEAPVWVDTETGEIIPEFTFKIIGAENIKSVKDFLDFAEISYQEV